MVDNQHKRIAGYRDLDAGTIELMNVVKMCEAGVAQIWREVTAQDEVNGRWLAIARTHFQEGFSAMIRALTQPADPFDGEIPKAQEVDRG